MLVLFGLARTTTEAQLHAALKPYGAVQALVFPSPDAEALDPQHLAGMFYQLYRLHE
jgi:hypothetical protein